MLATAPVGASIRRERLIQSLHLGGVGGGVYWIRGVYLRVGVYQIIYGSALGQQE